MGEVDSYEELTRSQQPSGVSARPPAGTVPGESIPCRSHRSPQVPGNVLQALLKLTQPLKQTYEVVLLTPSIHRQNVVVREAH